MIPKKNNTPISRRRPVREATTEPWEDIIQMQDDAYDAWCERQASDPLGLLGDDEDDATGSPKCSVCGDNGCDQCPDGS
jgi:hypothetical protein